MKLDYWKFQQALPPLKTLKMDLPLKCWAARPRHPNTRATPQAFSLSEIILVCQKMVIMVCQEKDKISHQTPITTEIKKRRLNWLGHMLRLPDRTPAKLTFREHLKKAKGNRGRPKQTWIRQINKDLEPINTTMDKLTENDYERKEWKKTVAMS